MPFDPPADVAFHAGELAFDNVADDERLKGCLEVGRVDDGVAGPPPRRFCRSAW